MERRQLVNILVPKSAGYSGTVYCLEINQLTYGCTVYHVLLVAYRPYDLVKTRN